MKVYTKSGDKGMTSLVGGERVFKTDERVEAYGTVDELAAFTALLCDRLREDAALTNYIDDLNRILSRLMSVEAVLAMGQTESIHDKVTLLSPEAVTWLEGRIDFLQENLTPIDKFTIPGGNIPISMCHVCRTVCRRAERTALRADRKHNVDPTALVWLNRLSDYFYLLGRTLTTHYQIEETLWIP
ncbi:MAG: cob(I)yrinic acid a,c-diamide adenosyltransferase [Alistipes sp.]